MFSELTKCRNIILGPKIVVKIILWSSVNWLPGSEHPHLCLQCHKIILKAFMFLDITLYGLEVSTELLWDAGVLLLHAWQSVLDVAVESMKFTGTTKLLITSFHLRQKSLPAIPTSPTIRPWSREKVTAFNSPRADNRFVLRATVVFWRHQSSYQPSVAVLSQLLAERPGTPCQRCNIFPVWIHLSPLA